MEIRNEAEARAWVRAWQQDGGLRIGILKAAVAGMRTCVGLTYKTPDMQAEYRAALTYLDGVLAELEIQREQAARDRERLEEARQDLAEARMDRIANGYRHW
jgi:transposase-like protein